MAVLEETDLGAELKAAQQYIGVLEAHLRKYGKHRDDCAYVTTSNRYVTGAPCNCGLDDRPHLDANEVTLALEEKKRDGATIKKLREQLSRMSDAIEALHQEALLVNSI